MQPAFGITQTNRLRGGGERLSGFQKKIPNQERVRRRIGDALVKDSRE